MSWVILPTEREPLFFDRTRTYATSGDAVRMLLFQGFDADPYSPNYWGRSHKIVQSVDTAEKEEYTGQMPTETPTPNAKLRSEIAAVLGKALGPHLDTPIYDQLAREYDERYGTNSYFDSALYEKLNGWKKGRTTHVK